MPSHKDKLIVALDSKELEDSRRLTEELDSLVSFYKIGLRTFVTDGFNFASYLKNKGKRIFLDLKLFDIQSTIEETVAKLSNLDIDFLTVHGDPSIVEAAVKGKKNTDMRVVFMGNPSFAIPTLKALMQSDHDVVAVVSNPIKRIGRNNRRSLTPVGSFAVKNKLTNKLAYSPK